jgi:TRAP-type mannitol/chloroaromatic compound transport system permease small subunit
MLSPLLFLSRLIDRVNEIVGRLVYWLVLLAVIVSSANAVIRYTFDASSNAWLELQWYLFAAVFMLGAGYTLLRNEHVRIDILSSRFSPRVQAWIDILGGLFFLLPIVLIILVLSVSPVVSSFRIHEMSNNAGGLLRWPVKALVPAGLTLLALQAVSEIVKRAAFLAGRIADPRGSSEPT